MKLMFFDIVLEDAHRHVEEEQGGHRGIDYW
jgi:hypothetical protein